MCKVSGDPSPSFFSLAIFLGILKAKELRSLVLTLFGIMWAMPKMAVEMLTCWGRHLGKHQGSPI